MAAARTRVYVHVWVHTHTGPRGVAIHAHPGICLEGLEGGGGHSVHREIAFVCGHPARKALERRHHRRESQGVKRIPEQVEGGPQHGPEVGRRAKSFGKAPFYTHIGRSLLLPKLGGGRDDGGFAALCLHGPGRPAALNDNGHSLQAGQQCPAARQPNGLPGLIDILWRPPLTGGHGPPVCTFRNA